MAEALGTAAAVVQLTELTAKVLSTGYAFLAGVANAPNEIRQLLTETAALDFLLGRLSALAKQTASTNVPDDALLALRGVGLFDECRDLLSCIDRSLASFRVREGERVRNAARRLVWPLHAQREVKEFIERLGRLKGLLSTALETNTA